MPRTLKEYQQRWQDAVNPNSDSSASPFDDELSPTACIVYESARSIPIGEGCSYFSDFGDAVCFYRYLRIPEELDISSASAIDNTADLSPELAKIGWTWNRYRSCFDIEELQQRRYKGELKLDQLLEHFVREGYKEGMGVELIEIVNATLIDFELHNVYVLPGDLPALLDRQGSLLAD